MLVFIDDSGDPGFKFTRGSTPVFVIALVIFDDNLEAEKTSLAVKELRRTLGFPDYSEFRFNKDRPEVRLKFLETVRKFNFRVRAIVMRKDLIRSPALTSSKVKFFNYTVKMVLQNSGGSIKNAKLKIDAGGERELRNQLRVYLSKELNNKESKIFSDLKFVDSEENTLIQLADMVAGAINYSYSSKPAADIYKEAIEKRLENVWEFK